MSHHHEHATPVSGARLLITLLLNLLITITEIIGGILSGSLSLTDINDKLVSIEDVKNIHHVHLWQMDEHDIHFEAHVDIADRLVSETEPLLQKITELLHENFEINHVTLQFECDACTVTELINN